MKEEIIDIIKTAIRNYVITVGIVIMFISAIACIQHGVIGNLLLTSLKCWLIFEVTYFLLYRLVRYVERIK